MHLGTFQILAPISQPPGNISSPIPYWIMEKYLGLGFKALQDVLWLPDQYFLQLLPPMRIFFQTHLKNLFFQEDYSTRYFLPGALKAPSARHTTCLLLVTSVLGCPHIWDHRKCTGSHSAKRTLLRDLHINGSNSRVLSSLSSTHFHSPQPPIVQCIGPKGLGPSGYSPSI